MFIVYVLYNSVADKFYVGQTQNLDARLAAHNNKHKTMSYTARFKGEWKVIYTESLPTRSEALKREKQLKSHQGREYIRQYIPG
jgi:putative endonuclease